MKSLFTNSGSILLESLSFTKTLYAFDFDGTLAKIVREPNAAYTTKATNNLLLKLSKLASVAIISGRSIKDLKKRLHFVPEILVGNHGLEGIDKKKSSLNQLNSICQTWITQLKKHSFGSGVKIENKEFSIAIHYRSSKNKKNAKEAIHKALSQLSPQPRIVLGKSVFNLIPIGAPHKGIAIQNIMKKIGAKNAFYIGDDDTDEDVFSLPDSNIFSVRIGKKRTSHAKFFVSRQSDINKVLKIIISNLSQEKI